MADVQDIQVGDVVEHRQRRWRSWLVVDVHTSAQGARVASLRALDGSGTCAVHVDRLDLSTVVRGLATQAQQLFETRHLAVKGASEEERAEARVLAAALEVELLDPVGGEEHVLERLTRDAVRHGRKVSLMQSRGSLRRRLKRATDEERPDIERELTRVERALGGVS